MTDARLVGVPDEDQSTPRRTIRIPDDEWESALAAAEANGESLSAVIRRRIADYAQGAATVEYRATSRTNPALVVENVTGPIDEVRSLFPARHWHVEVRESTGYRPVGRRSV